MLRKVHFQQIHLQPQAEVDGISDIGESKHESLVDLLQYETAQISNMRANKGVIISKRLNRNLRIFLPQLIPISSRQTSVNNIRRLHGRCP